MRRIGQLGKAVRSGIGAYLIISFFVTPVVPAFAQETENPSPSSDSGGGVLISEPSATEVAADSPVSETGESAQVGSPQSASPDATQPQEETAPSPEEENESAPPPEEGMSSMSQGVGNLNGGADGSPSTIKQVIPGVDQTTGALVYNYPLKFPPGRNGIEPNLELSYNSLSTNADSLFGYGWSSNIPYIQRINRDGVNNVYAESYFESSLSGELVSTAGSSSTFQARVDAGDFLKYDLASSSASSTWRMTDKLGKIYTFGNTSSSRQFYQDDPTRTFKWLLTEVRDLNDNYMTYEYFSDSAQVYPSKIYYTQYGTSTNPFEINFARQSRSDTTPKFDKGFNVTTLYQINEISAKFNGDVVKKYTLNYTTSTTSLLNAITESGQVEASSTISSLPATQFEYQGSVENFVYDDSGISCPSGLSTTKGVIPIDVNADGFSDLLESTNSASTTYLNNKDGTWTSNVSFAPPLVFWQSGTSTPDFGVRIADLDADGRADMFRSMNGTSTVYFNTPSGWSLSTGSAWAIPEDIVTSAGADRGVRIFDLNGDGLPDFVRTYAGATSTASNVYLNNGSGWNANDSGWNFPVGLQEGVILGDFNNDGLIDLAQSYKTDSTHWLRYTFLNNGNRYWSIAGYTPPIEFNHLGNDWGVREADVNGDGFSDLIQGRTEVGEGIYLNNGLGWSSSTMTPPFDFIGNDANNDLGVRLADYTGDGQIDAIDCNDGAEGADQFYRNPSIRANLVKRVKSPFGGATNVSYKPTSKFKNGATFLNENLPFILDAVETVSQGDGVSATSTKTFTYEGGKQYYVNALDRKMAGFAKVTSTDSASTTTSFFYHQGNNSSSTIGEYNDQFSKIGKVYRTEVADSVGNIYSKTIRQWDSATTTPGAFFVFPTQTVALTYDGDSDHKDKAENYSYSSSTGNLLTKTEWGEVTGGDDGTFSDVTGDKRLTTITYASNTPDYVLALPSIETITNASSSKVKETRYYYDNGALGTVDNGNLTKQEGWKSSNLYIDTEKTYNAYGLVTQIKDPRDKATNFTYDTWNLYPATSTNALSQSTGYVYNYSSGQVAQRTDSNGFVFQTIFDGLDRVIEEKQPDLVTPSTLVTKNTTSYTDAYDSSNILNINYLNAGTSTSAYTYLDGFGRVLQTRTEAESTDLFTVADTLYNNLERVQKESLPYFSTGSSRTSATSTTDLYIQYTYDPMLRVANTTNAVGTVSKSYDDWVVTITDALGKPKRLYSDSYNNLIRVDEINASSTYTTTYSYDEIGDLTKITDALGNIRTFTYDRLGRRTAANDLHKSNDSTYGIWFYTFDDSGNLTQTLDPKNQTVNYTYDDLNRVLTENYTGSYGTDILYAYDSCTNGIGRVCTATSTGATTAQYLYNALGNISREIKTVSSTAYQTDYTYDRQGNPLTIVNPDNSEIQYLYNAAGQLEQIQQKESGGAYQDIVTDFDYGPHGKVTHRVNANCTETTNIYDAERVYRLSNILTLYTCTSEEESMMLSGVDEESTIGVTPDNLQEILNSIPQFENNVASPTSTASSSSSFLDSAKNFVSAATAALKNAVVVVGDYLVSQFNIPVAYAEELYNNSLYTDPNLVAYWRLEGNSSSTIGSYNGTDNSISYATSTGRYGQGAAFTTAGANIVTSGMGSISNFSVSMWVQQTSDYSGTQQEGAIWGNNDGWNGNGQPYAYLRSSTNNPNTSGASWLLLNDYGDDPDNAGTGVAYAQQVDFNDNQWHHVVVTYNASSSTEKYYEDGILVRTNIFSSRPTTTFNTFTIGSSNFSGTYRSHSGNIDDVAVFSRAISAAEIADLYQTGAPNSIQDILYTYDENGNITRIADISGTDTAKNVDFTYDDLNRLVSASSSNAVSGSNYFHLYNYDAIGNITSSTPAGIYGYTTSTTGYVNPHAVITIASSTYTYDKNGNLTSDGTWAHTWDYRNRLATSSSTTKLLSYQYDHSNTRVQFKTSNTTSTIIASPTYSVENGTAVKYITANGQLIASIRGTGTSTAAYYWTHPDHLGSQEKSTGSDGAVVELTDYYPYGGPRQEAGSLNDRKGYIGVDTDPDTGLSQTGARYYKSAVGRFISQDPVFWEKNQNLQDPQSLNSYSYGNNNPIINKDPLGRYAIGGNLGVGAEFGALITPYGAITASVGVAYVKNSTTGESWIAFPISFGANIGFLGAHHGYPNADQSPLVLGVFAGGGPSISYSPGAMNPDDLSGSEESFNINAPISFSSQGTKKNSPTYTLGAGAKGVVSLSMYPVKTWTPSINMTTIAHVVNSAQQSIQNQINAIQAQINAIQAQINAMRNGAIDSIFGSVAKPNNSSQSKK